MSWYSRTWNWVEGKWIEGNPPLMGPRTHAAWLGSSVFDGARYFEHVMPDLRAHCQRVNDSAQRMGMKPVHSTDEIMSLAKEGVKRFDAKSALYLKPMYWSEAEGLGVVAPDPESTRFCLTLFEAPMPEPTGFAMGISTFRRPTAETAPTEVKTGSLYPNNARCLMEAKSRGFGNAVVRDVMGNVAETATSNLFLVKDGVVITPAANGCFLNGITRQRVIALLREEGRRVLEQRVTVDDLLNADEVFTSGNYGKVVPCTRIEEKRYAIGPVYRKTRELYWAWSHDRRSAE